MLREIKPDREKYQAPWDILANRPGLYTLEEDKLLVEMYINRKSFEEIAVSFQKAGYRRSPTSLHIRIKKLEKVEKKFDTLEAYHASLAASN